MFVKIFAMTVNEPAAEYLSLHREYKRAEHLGGLKLIHLSREGIRMDNLRHLRERTGLDLPAFARILQITPRTLQNKEASDNLGVSVSEKALELAMLFARGVDVFGNHDRFISWMRKPCRALENERPLDLLDTRFGFDAVTQVMGRMEHGVIS